MKTINYVLMFAIVGLFAIALNGCKNCSGEDPRAKIINNGTEKASVQIKTSGGNTVNINNVDPGTTSAYSSYAAGQVTFTITVKSIPFVKVVDMSQCYDYDIAIDANNNITVTSINRE